MGYEVENKKPVAACTKQILSLTETSLHQLGAKSVRLDAFIQNHAAVALYQKHGYQIVGLAHQEEGDAY